TLSRLPAASTCIAPCLPPLRDRRLKRAGVDTAAAGPSIHVLFLPYGSHGRLFQETPAPSATTTVVVYGLRSPARPAVRGDRDRRGARTSLRLWRGQRRCSPATARRSSSSRARRRPAPRSS